MNVTSTDKLGQQFSYNI